MLDLLTSRVEMYGLLRDAFSYPVTEGVIRRLSSLEPDGEAAPTLQAVARSLHGILGQARQGEELLEDLNREHSRLMAGPGLPPAPPYGSYYRDAQGALFGQETQTVADVYRRHGFVPASPGVPADHLALELEFMAALAETATVAAAERRGIDLRDSLGVQRSFLREHLIPLSRAFTNCLLEAEPSDFFAGLTQLLHQYLSADLAFLQEVDTPLQKA
ncbi:MAG: molecular chaperone TorD family protein [Chloroflexi bacterium]|nr:molecular chaperone TorD family protein [Chloroflexota bacterium]